MYQVWKYLDATDTERLGIIVRHSDFGGTDISYCFHRLGDDGRVIEFDNGGHRLNIVSGPRLKLANRVGAMEPGGSFGTAR